jgi:hypothetical protein
MLCWVTTLTTVKFGNLNAAKTAKPLNKRDWS